MASAGEHRKVRATRPAKTSSRLIYGVGYEDRITRFAAAFEHEEAPHHLDRVLEHAELVAARKCFRAQGLRAKPRQARVVEVQQPPFESVRYQRRHVPSSEQHGQI